MAYLIQIERKRCQRPGCALYATARLFNRVNSELGAFCRIHARLELSSLDKREWRAWAEEEKESNGTR